ncbi:helix-turn-helix domain-containing protein [Metabacillus litoralis]|uniref:helix-turn-helix domain-containing protein n=1 Tax=Metabacillus litoralis TaxID=152268 RepID=UPI00204049E1|nr:helix-turn-helix transcriptional regulator [Metabacillus litoralis]MCM3651287.1 helix-turn-helix transcriptional regulator [Metabacillus litoralis]
MNDLTPKILEELRESKGWSKTEVARRLGIKTVSTYANWEYGLRTPDKDMLSRIADLYGVTTDYLIDGKEKTNLDSKSSSLSEKDEKDIAKRMEKIREDLTKDDGYMLMGEPISEEAKESILDAMEYAIRQATRINKKYIPKKYRDKQE